MFIETFRTNGIDWMNRVFSPTVKDTIRFPRFRDKERNNIFSPEDKADIDPRVAGEVVTISPIKLCSREFGVHSVNVHGWCQRYHNRIVSITAMSCLKQPTSFHPGIQRNQSLARWDAYHIVAVKKNIEASAGTFESQMLTFGFHL